MLTAAVRFPVATTSASQVADFFIGTVGDATHLKIQKLCYYSQGFHLALSGQPLFEDALEAWQHGPVVRSQYQRFRGSGSGILQPTRTVTLSCFEAAARPALQTVLLEKGHKTGWQLRNESHDEDPWRLCYGRPNSGIPLSLMQRWFGTRVRPPYGQEKVSQVRRP